MSIGDWGGVAFAVVFVLTAMGYMAAGEIKDWFER